MESFIVNFVGFIWNWPVTMLCLLGCIYFSFNLRFAQITTFSHAIALLRGKFDDPNEKGQISHFQALSAALSATIGLGNISGVAIAIALGGPGTIFWMWIIGFFGMATKYVECSLGTHYREINPNTGEAHGGPMYYISKALSKKFKPLSYFYAIAICLAAFGAGCMFQSNQAAQALQEYYNVPTLLTGCVLFFLSFCVIIGGIKRIGQVASKIVPSMCFVYIGCSLLICLLNIHLIPAALKIILIDAFTGTAVAGGFVPVLFWGIRRAIFSNEAGLGSAAIAHAAVKTNYPIREGIVASLGPLIDTIVVCTATAMVIILSGNFGTQIYHSTDSYNNSFETKQNQQNYILDWNVINKEKAPSSDQNLIDFINGNHVLHYKKSTLQKQPTSIFNIPNEQEFKFSYFKQSGHMQINVYDSSRNLIGSVDSQSKFNTQSISIKKFNTSNNWESAILSVKDTNSEKLIIQFIPLENNTEWYFDSLSTVKKLNGIALTTRSFDHFFKGFGSIFITFAVLFFAFSTMITWSYYGETALYFLFGSKPIMAYKILFVTFVLIGSVQSLDMIIHFSDAMIGLLVIPNMIALIFLSKEVKQWTIDYFKQLKSGKIKAFK